MRLRRPDRQDSTGKGLRHHIEPDEKIRNRGNFHARDTDFPKEPAQTTARDTHEVTFVSCGSVYGVSTSTTVLLPAHYPDPPASTSTSLGSGM